MANCNLLSASHAALFSVAIAASGCAGVETASITEGISVGAITERAQCELKVAYLANREDFPWLDHWAASFNITVKQEDSAGLGPSVTYATPLNFHQTFNLTAGASYDGTGTRTLTTKRTVLLKDLRRFNCEEPSGTYLANKLYIMEPFRDALHAREKNHVVAEEPDAVGYRIDFVAKATAHANPSFALYRVTGLGADFKVSREKTQSIDIAFTDATPAGPQRVLVTNFPNATPPRRDTPPTATRGTKSTISPDVRQRLDNTLQRLQLENLLPQRR